MITSEEKKVVAFIVENETGEIINEIYEGDINRTTRKESLEYLNKKKKEEEEKVIINQGKKFTKLIEHAGVKLARAKLTSNQYAIILGVCDYIEYETGLLKMNCGRNAGRLLNASDIMKICEINPKTYSRVIGELIDEKILGQTKVGREIHFIVNPFIFYNGKCEIPKTTYELFKNSKWNPNFKENQN